ncbi:MAG: acyl-CoA dehydrogenase [Bradyrhizobiaceae bacterium]|nr:MAG: acyl-CoA dehydrogenase [Bradyrhizobiaceae bacterium]
MLETSAEDLAMIRQTVRNFVRTRLHPLEPAIDAADDVDPQLLAQLRGEVAKLGLYGFNMPAELGGPGLSVTAQVVIAEEVTRTIVALTEVFGHLPLSLALCNAEQRSRLLPGIVRGEKTVTYALTEPDAGSDLGAIKTRAVKVDGGWRLDGSKQFISNVETSDYVIVLAATDPSAPLKRKLGTFIVEGANPGIRGLTRFRKMGWRGYHLNGFSLEGCVVPDRDVLGAPSDGFLAMMKSINHDRLFAACRCLGLAARAHEMSLDWAKERVTFGAPLAQHQAIQFMIADNDTEIVAARALIRLAAELADAGSPDFRIAASRAKLYASEMVGRVTDRVLQIFGGMGYMCDLPIERFYRDARAFRIGEGTSEMQRLQIARHVLAS